jgi:hypothetical protein
LSATASFTRFGSSGHFATFQSLPLPLLDAGVAARAKPFAGISVSPHGVGAQSGRLIATSLNCRRGNTAKTQLNATNANCIWRGMVEIEPEKNEKDQALM